MRLRYHLSLPAVFMSWVDNVGITLRGTVGLGQWAGEFGIQELRSEMQHNSEVSTGIVAEQKQQT